ncbi:hypothetical protein [Paenibacillus spongiae]|uniref:Uncharacterized protein n=1 Tax=Paenibacillus spongiae TaxID=2909671 RepID=A0ABY5SAA8_9BACL|nr:hypothetical protein [Paenibacillus spongiae]UVI30877.1 hypothetical protein L1F29_03095 [Paenibacillus spongiae]
MSLIITLIEVESGRLGIIGLKVRHNESGEVEPLESEVVFAFGGVQGRRYRHVIPAADMQPRPLIAMASRFVYGQHV